MHAEHLLQTKGLQKNGQWMAFAGFARTILRRQFLISFVQTERQLNGRDMGAVAGMASLAQDFAAAIF